MSQVIEKEPVIMPNAPEPPTPGNDHRPPQTRGQKLLRWLMGPVGVTVLVFVIFVALLGYGFAVLVNTGLQSSQSSGTSTGMQMNPTATPSNVPNATQNYGAQPAQYAVAADGTKVFHFTAEQVMWEPVHGHPRVLAWTLDGTVPGPTIRVTAGDHLRISITNHFPEATTLHWHGLEIPANQDGVPGVGQDPIKPGQTYTYDFTVPLDNVGTYFYHSHYDDMIQVSGGLYGAFIVDPKLGTPEAAQAIHTDQEYLQMISELGGYYVINGKSFPDTQVMHVKHGQTIHVRLINIGELIHPMHMHGHFFTVVAEDGQMEAYPQKMETITTAPGESYDLLFYAWAAPGSIYPFHCHILSHVMNPGDSSTEMGGLITLIEYDK
ncbi:MAG TPA: multicopper oxidase domain-containing protein [Ktedonobacterales bacterium]|nr:multicopper oxidase domain-containing protein [Ktedonobacterales bacterium]